MVKDLKSANSSLWRPWLGHWVFHDAVDLLMITGLWLTCQMRCLYSDIFSMKTGCGIYPGVKTLSEADLEIASPHCDQLLWIVFCAMGEWQRWLRNEVLGVSRCSWSSDDHWSSTHLPDAISVLRYFCYENGMWNIPWSQGIIRGRPGDCKSSLWSALMDCILCNGRMTTLT